MSEIAETELNDQQREFLINDMKRYAENMALPDSDRIAYLQEMHQKFKNDPVLAEWTEKAFNWALQKPASKMASSTKLNHYVKNLKPSMKASTLIVPKYESQFTEREKDFSDEKLYGTHRWK